MVHGRQVSMLAMNDIAFNAFKTKDEQGQARQEDQARRTKIVNALVIEEVKGGRSRWILGDVVCRTLRKTLVGRKAQRGLKAPVPHTYRWVELYSCSTRRKLPHSSCVGGNTLAISR